MTKTLIATTNRSSKRFRTRERQILGGYPFHSTSGGQKQTTMMPRVTSRHHLRSRLPPEFHRSILGLLLLYLCQRCIGATLAQSRIIIGE